MSKKNTIQAGERTLHQTEIIREGDIYVDPDGNRTILRAPRMSKNTAVKTTGGDRTQRPEGITDEHLEYPDELREIGETNMFGARPYLQGEFGIDGKLAATILSYWMSSFGNENR